MSREWSAVYAAMLTKPKYRRLTPMGRGGLLHVFLLAGFQSPEATWDDPDELRESLILEGFPAGIFDELLGLGWLELLPDGAVIVHDWDAHQLAATKEAQRAWERRRKQDWRRTKKAPGATPSPGPLTPTSHHNTPQHIGPGHVTDMSGTPGLDEVVGEYERLFGPASPGKVTYLRSILSRWPDAERVKKGLSIEQTNGATRKNICGRLEDGLSRGDKATATADYRAIEERVAEVPAA